MAHPTRAICDISDSEELFVWDRDAKEWRCNDCGALKQRPPIHKIDINGVRAGTTRIPLRLRKQRAKV